jgi:hypothetical protein
MPKPYYLLMFVLAIAIAYSQSQTSPSGSAAPGQTTPNNAGSIYGNTTSANPQAPSQGNLPAAQPGTTQSTPAGTGTQPPSTPGTATDASGGGVAGAAGSGAAQTQVPETPIASSNPPVSDAELQSQIQNALSKEPTLSGDNVRVSVAEDNIEVNGNVGSAREKLTASRIVQSYAGNKKVVSHLTIGGRSAANPSTPAANPDSKNSGSANSGSANPEPNKGAPPAGTTQPPRY